MILRPFVREGRRRLRHSRLLQIALIVAFWAVGEALARAGGLPIPGGVIGLFIVFALLASGRLSLSSVRRGANTLLADMLLFFVPAVMTLLEHREMLGWLGLKALAVVLMGTLVVMTVTAVTVDLLCLWSAPREPVRDRLE
jgi:holin-like protein